MQGLFLRDKNKEKLFQSIFQEILDNILDDDEQIINEIDQALTNLEDDDRNNVYQYLHQEFRNFSFFTTGNYGEQICQVIESVDYVQIYKELRDQNKYEEILQLLKNKEFCTKNNISKFISEKIQMVSKIGQRILDLLDFIDLIKQQKIDSNIHQLEFLKRLLNFLFCDELNNEEQIILEQIIGSQLIYEVYKFQFQIEMLKIRNQQDFQQFKEFLQKKQLQIEFDQQINKDFMFLANLFTQELKNSRQNLQKYLIQLLNLNQKICYKNIIGEIERYLIQGKDFQNLYFMITWHYLIQYAQQFQIISEQNEIFNKIQKIQIIERKLSFIERILMKSKKQNDEIFIYVMHRAIYFIDQNEDFLSIEHYQQYQKYQENLLIKYQSFQFSHIQDLISSPKQDFINFWQTIRQLQYLNLQNEKQIDSALQQMIIVLWQTEVQDQIYIAFQTILKQNQGSIKGCAEQIENQFIQYSIQFKSNLLTIASSIHQFDPLQLRLTIRIYHEQHSLKNMSFFLKFQEELYNKNRSLDQIQWFSQIKAIQWQSVKQFFQNSDLIDLVYDVFEFYKTILENGFCIFGQFFRNIFIILDIEQEKKLKCLEILVKTVSHKLIHLLFLLNLANNINISTLKITFYTFYLVYDRLTINDQQVFFKNIKYFITQNFYNFKLILEFLDNKVDLQIIHKFIQAHFYKSKSDQLNLIRVCFQIYTLNQNMYEEIFSKYNYFDVFQITPLILKLQQQQDFYPRKLNIKLEQFNISLAIFNKQQIEDIVRNWVQNFNNALSFQKLIPLFFNIIKKGENPDLFLSLVHQEMNKKYPVLLNLKAIFQILFNNSNQELQVMLLRFHSIQHPVPFIFQNPDFSSIQQEEDLYLLNHNLFYFFPKSYTIINFSFYKEIKRFGKTELINKIFYKQQLFERRDSCDITFNTIDILFDFCFYESRNFAVADSHGFIPISILIKILPLFKLWIIQIDTLIELEGTLQNIQILKRNVKGENFKILLIIRNFIQSEKYDLQKIQQKISQQKIDSLFIRDLTQSDLPDLAKTIEIENAQKFIFQLIDEQNPQTSVINQMDFHEVLKQYSNVPQHIPSEQYEAISIIQQLENELDEFISKEDGFFSQDCFPIRNAEYKIKLAKMKLRLNSYDIMDNKHAIRASLKQEIDMLEKSLQKQEQTKVLELFYSLFDKPNYYILYITLVDRLRKYNEALTSKYQEKIKEINEKLENLKKSKKQVIQSEEMYSTTKMEIEYLLKKFEENLKNLELKNIGIEIFWREVIQQQQFQKRSPLEVNPSEKIYEMIKKGEPFECLDGDSLQINNSFLKLLAETFPNKGNARVLVFSIIGPQSSGKSTLLNKIFGCHFWTKVGRCTKGIYLQILEVQNKDIFDNQFDYILLLDTEGLQNPNQLDPEFDKKMALFILAISDIILINVKGDINEQFKSLIEMCVYNLGQMKINLSTVKQLSWLFSQNDNANTKDPFFAQIRQISNNLNNIELQSDVNYDELLGIKDDNIIVLGVCAWQYNWQIQSNCKEIGVWRQTQYNETFSSEAYINGIKIIQNFISKVKKEQTTDDQHIMSLNSFIQNITINWEIIQKLPDLLEFTELIQYQQDKCMKDKFDKLFSSNGLFNFTYKIKEQIAYQVEQKKKKNLEFFKQVRKGQERSCELEFEKIRKSLSEQLQHFKQQNKISKKIAQKYQKQLDINIKSKEWESKFVILEEIKIYEREYQTKEGFAQIEVFLANIEEDHTELQRFQNDRQLIIHKFEELWTSITEKLKLEKNNVFDEFQKHWLESILLTNNQYTLKTNYDQEYLDFFSKQNKENPFSRIEEEGQIFEIFKQELNKNQFIFINQTKENIRYWDIFTQQISQKLLTPQSSDILDISQYFCYEIQFNVITKEQFMNYLNNNFLDDMKNLIGQISPQNRQYQMNQFFLILDEFQIKYDQTVMQELLNQITNQSMIFFFPLSSNSGNQILKAFEQLRLTFQFQKEIIQSSKFLDRFQSFYPKLKFETQIHQFHSLVDLNNYKNELLKQYIILSEKQKIKSLKEDEFIDFIMFPAADQYNSNMLTLFYSEMETNGGWKKLYCKIYEIIKEEFVINQPRINSQFIQNADENFTASNSQIKFIMSKIEQEIYKFNEQFAKFGFILSDFGKRTIYYYSILIIWRFGCYKKWELLENSWNQEKDKDNEFEKFEAKIMEKKSKQNSLKAKTLVKNIIKGFYDQFYKKVDASAINDVKPNQLRCVDVVKQLDEKLLENFKENQEIQSQNIANIVEYVRNQRKYIEIFVKEEIETQKELLIQKYQDIFTSEITAFLNLILYNSNLIKNQVSKCKQTKTRDYFSVFLKNDSSYEKQLFIIVVECITGKVQFDINLIEEQYQNVFKQNFQSIKTLINIRSLSESDEEIQNLHCFITGVVSELVEKLQQTSKNYPISVGSLNINSTFDEKKLIMNGCQYSCPMCKRKCDLDSDFHEKHECLNGHYLRGMNGILIGNKPSLYTCEEIEDDAEILTFETKIVKSWKQVKSMYPEWKFRSQNDIQQHKEKVMKVWNNGVGKVICNHLTQELRQSIQFVIKLDEKFEQQHYIIMLDDSGSMEGIEWLNIKDATLTCMADIQQKPNAKVSVIIFNHIARLVIDCDTVDIGKQKDKIQFHDGRTDLSQAFHLAYQQIVKYQQFTKIVILCYTDGKAYYPQKEMEKICKLPEIIRDKIILIASTNQDKGYSLQMIADHLDKKIQMVQLKNSIKTNTVQSVWSETVRKSFHQLKC